MPERQPNPKKFIKRSSNVSNQYKLLKALGDGAYGVVYQALDKSSNIEVAIKKIQLHEGDHGATVCRRTLREIKLLRYFKHENIVSLRDIQKPESYETFSEVNLVLELVYADMSEVIRSHPVTEAHCQLLIYQILRALKVMHSANILHRDLKPANLLVTQEWDVKVCDLGLARKDSPKMTEYVATRWYRAPEVMLQFNKYTAAIDVWSVGCIMAELLNSTPLFPGKNYCNQLDLIFDVLGTPAEEDYYEYASKRTRDYIRSLPLKQKKPWRTIFPNTSELALDLLEKLLAFSPKKRITVEDALKHKYLEEYHATEDEQTARPISDGFFHFDDETKKQLTGEQLKQLLYNEIMQGSN